MYKKFTLILLCSFIFVACSKDEPSVNLFHLTIGVESNAKVVLDNDNRNAEIIINGYEKTIEIGIMGNYDYLLFSDDIPHWCDIRKSETQTKYFTIEVAPLTNTESRTAMIAFTVFKGTQSQTGTITIVQNPNTIDDLKKTEQLAIKSYLSKFDVIDRMPPITEIVVGSVAPFYKLDETGNVYMQVVHMGSGPKASNGEKIYFRFLRYNLLDYYKNGALPTGWGNAYDLSQSPAHFTLGSNEPSTTQWGQAIQMPLQMGLPVDSEVNLVVASEAGFANEVNSVIPFLYNIRYYPDNE